MCLWIRQESRVAGGGTWYEAVKGRVTRSWLAVGKAGISLIVGAWPVKDGCMCLDTPSSRAGSFIPLL